MKWTRFPALVLKELRQIRRDRRLMLSLIVPPLLQILLFGFALNPEVRDLKVGIVDDSRTAESRDLIAAITENRTFRRAGAYATTAALERALAHGSVDVGIVVPYDFARERARGRPVDVQVLVNAVNANSAQIAQGHVEGAIAWLNETAETGGASRVRVEARPVYLYNAGLVYTWFTVTGVLGTLIMLNGSLVAAATMIKEKERGTVEQLLMTPATALEVITAKIAPLFVLMMGMTALALTVARLVFHVPLRGSLALLLAACACAVLTGIGVGTLASTVARSATQAQLVMFFVNPPLVALSGALTPIEAMPEWVQPWTQLNPIAHFATIARDVLVKGSGLDVVHTPLLILAGIAILLVGASAWRFRTQMA